MSPPTTLRRETAGLVKLADRDLAALWRLVAQGASAETALRDLLPAIITTYGAAGATVAADWYDDLRDKADAKGSFRAIPASLGDAGAQSLAGWAVDTATDDKSLQTLVLGGVQRRIANFVRGTITGSSIADPSAVGWKRIGAGSCAFCNMLIGRDVTYTEASADFASHDNCNCGAYPLIKGAEPIDVKDYIIGARRKVGPDGEVIPISDADRDRVKRYLESH